MKGKKQEKPVCSVKGLMPGVGLCSQVEVDGRTCAYERKCGYQMDGREVQTMQDWRDSNPNPAHGCGHMQGRGAA